MWNTPPKSGVGGWGVRRGGQSAVKVTEMMEKKKTIETFPFESETRPLDHKYLRKGSRCLNINQLHLYIETWSSILW